MTATTNRGRRGGRGDAATGRKARLMPFNLFMKTQQPKFETQTPVDFVVIGAGAAGVGGGGGAAAAVEVKYVAISIFA